MAKQRNSTVPAASAPRWHRDALRISGRLTNLYREMYQPEAAMITPLDVIKVLNKAKVKVILMGTHGIGGYRDQSRATEDVDVLVRLADLRKAIKALRAAFPQLTFQDMTVVVRFRDPATGKPVIDLMKPLEPVYQLALRSTVKVGTYYIPSLEMALVSKFAAMTSPNRSYDKKLIDGGDFVNMVRKNLKDIDRAKLRRLADKVYPDGSKEILQMIEDIAAGRPIKF